MSGDARLARWGQCGRAPVPAKVSAVIYHLRLILRLSDRERRVHIEILRPCIVGAELQAPAQPPVHFKLEGVVAAVACRVPEETGSQERIRTRRSCRQGWGR